MIFILCHSQKNTSSYLYEPPQLDSIKSYLNGSRSDVEHCRATEQEESYRGVNTPRMSTTRNSIDRSLCFLVSEEHTQNRDEELEERLHFIEALRFAYHKQVEDGKTILWQIKLTYVHFSLNVSACLVL